MGLSSLFYLFPAYHFFITPGYLNEVGALLYILVSIFSALADGSLLEEPFFAPGVIAPYAGLIDRWMATLGWMYAFFMWLRQPFPSPMQFLIETLLVLGSVLPLHFARVTPFDQPWRWAVLQIFWHLTSALLVVHLAPHPTDSSGHLITLQAF